MHTSNGFLQKAAKIAQILLHRISYYLMLTLFWVFAICVFGEIAVRCFCDAIPGIHSCIKPVEDARYYVLKPGITFHFDGIDQRLPHPVIWQTDNHGVRIGVSSGAATSISNKIRVATYGDSEIFGWGLDSRETFQEQWEKLDNRIEVTNFGVPGYNVCQIAEHIERTVQLMNPDIVMYVVNPNDFDISLNFSFLPKSSELLKRLVFLYYIIKKKRAQKMRNTEAVIHKFAVELVRMKRFCEKNNRQFVLAFLEADNRFIISEDPELKQYFLDGQAYNGRVIDLSPARVCREIDHHFVKKVHEIMAGILVEHFVKYGWPQAIPSPPIPKSKNSGCLLF